MLPQTKHRSHPSAKIFSYLRLRYGLYLTGLAVGGVLMLREDFFVKRFLRTAFTACDIILMYKRNLYYKEWDESSLEYYDAKSRAHAMGALKLLNLLKANKGVYIKVGQHIASLDYVLPSEYTTTMRVLHKDAPENSVEQIFRVIKKNLHRDPKEIFIEFENKPLGTASIAQVHKARLKESGDVVAVKVQHEVIESTMQLDFRCMEFFIYLGTIMIPEFQMKWLVDETKRNVIKELDFIEEGKNAEKAAERFKDFPWLRVPKIFWNYSTAKVLVMEYVEGGQVNDTQFIKDKNIDPYDLCQKIGGLYAHMIIVDGFLHCDPHPGNMLIEKDGRGVIVNLLDHGLYSELTESFRYHYAKLWLAIVSRDVEQMKIYTNKLGVNPNYYHILAVTIIGRPLTTILKGVVNTEIDRTDEKRRLQQNFAKHMRAVSECLQTVDPQALLVFKTNDWMRYIEGQLNTGRHMCSYKSMHRCCLRTIYDYEFKNATMLWRPLISMQYIWKYVKLQLYSLVLR